MSTHKFPGLSVPRHAKRASEVYKPASTRIGRHRAVRNDKGNLRIGAPVATLLGFPAIIAGYRGRSPLVQTGTRRDGTAILRPVVDLDAIHEDNRPIVQFAA